MKKKRFELENKELTKNFNKAVDLLKEARDEILQNREDLEEAEAIMGVLKDLRLKNDELLNIYRAQCQATL